MNSKKVLFICSAGITTGLIVRSVQKSIDEKQVPIHVYSAPSIVAQQIINDEPLDAIMIGPHIQHEVERLRELLNYKKIPFKLIDADDYKLLNGEGILADVMSLLSI